MVAGLIAFTDGARVIAFGIGIGLMLLLEAEKLAMRRTGWSSERRA